MKQLRAFFHPDPVYVPGAGYAPASPPSEPVQVSKFKPQDQRMVGSGSGKVEDSWQRAPKTTGSGASHVKSFHCKLTGESLEFMDRQINEWLDAHPDYEVKFCSTSVGEWSGKSMKEPNLIVQVWV
jgi:hypothetical protein